MKKSGTYTWFGYESSFEERLQKIKEAGFDTICTFWDRSMESMDGKLEDQPEKADKVGLYLEHTHLPYYGCDALWNNDLKAQALRDLYIEGVKSAKDAFIKTLVIHPYEIYVPKGKRYTHFYDNMRRITDVCADVDIRIAIENLGENELLPQIIDDLGDNPCVGFCFDSGHNNVVNHNDFFLLEKFSDKLFATHIHDNNSQKDQHLLPYSDSCNVDWKECLIALNNTSFTGSLMLEASYPIDYDALNKPDSTVPVPDMPMIEWLMAAKESCDKIYSEIDD